jgi:hypothetical protein
MHTHATTTKGGYQMRRLSHAEFVIAADSDSNQIHNLNVRGQVALAFGRNAIAQSLSYIEVDALCHRIADVLTESYSRKMAASFVRVHFDTIAQVLAAAEADPARNKFFSVIDFFVRGKRQHTCCGTTTSDPELVAFELARTPLTAKTIVNRVTSINVTGLRAEIVASAECKGIDIAAPWLPALGSTELAELLQPYMQLRDDAVATVVAAAGAKSRKTFEKMIPATGALN